MNWIQWHTPIQNTNPAAQPFRKRRFQEVSRAHAMSSGAMAAGARYVKLKPGKMRTRRTAEATDSARFTGVRRLRETGHENRWPVPRSVLLWDGLPALEPLALQIRAELVHLAVLDGSHQDTKETRLFRHFVV